jgi:uncharacterized protein YaaQ
MSGGFDMTRDELKLMITILADDDAEELISQFVSQGMPATKVSSTGGLLRKGSATILSCIDASVVDGAMRIVRRECRARTEVITADIPTAEGSFVPSQVEVRVGRAVVLVLPVERFEKT